MRGLIITQKEVRQLTSRIGLTAYPRILSFDRTQGPGLWPIFTGHNTLRRHLYIIGQINRLLRRRCGAQVENSAHVLSVKPWLQADTLIWAPFLDTEEVRSLSLGDFSKGTGLQWLDVCYGTRSPCPEILRAPGLKRLESIFYSILFYSILFYYILFYSILFYSILFYSILFYSILFHSILFYSILFYFMLIYSFWKASS